MDGADSNPSSTFAAVANETRVDVLDALASAYSEDPADPWLSYTALREATGVRDTGNFNYHLDELGGFVVRGEAGYTLSPSGLAFVTSVAAGEYDAEWTWGPVDAPGTCPFCDDPVELVYEGGTLWLTCGREDHEMGLAATPGLLASHPREDVVEHVAFLGTQWAGLLQQGICSECHGVVDGAIEYGGVQPDHYHYRGRCRRCGFQHGVPLGLYLLGHPTVRRFFYDHGVDVRTTPFWALEFCKPGTESVVSEDPLRVRVDVKHEGDTLSVTVDGDGEVVERTGD